MSKPLLFAVTGKPVAHSLSPDIFRLLFAALGLDAVYMRLAADSAREALETAWAIGLRGLNVTSPFKEEMLSICDDKDEHAAKIGAVNCLRLDRLTSTGYNTDFIGLIGTLSSYCISPAGRAALVLGTGGAARAAAYGLAGAGAAKIILAGRSPGRTKAVAEALGCAWASIADAGQILGEVDICVSCLPFPASRILAGRPREGYPVIDAHYASAPGAPAAGRPHLPPAHRWLFHQAIPSFEIMTGLGVSESLRQKIFEQFATLRARPKRDIALVGFMGTGKTATGRQLARLMGREFVDTDETAEAVAGMSVPEIFARRGERSFRSLETAVIGKLMSGSGRRKVISVGGGAVLDAANRRLLADTCRVVWLWAPARTALSRVDVATRPVLDPGEPLASAERTLAARLPLYAAVSDLLLHAASGSPLDIARRIKDEMDQTL
jgi:shikimate dehydrogenase